MNQRFSAWLSLFASTGTLFCCALPSLLVVLGMGASMAGLISTVPQLIWLSQYKAYVFALSGLMIFIAAIAHYRSRFDSCPTDPVLAKACTSSRHWSLIILLISAATWCLGAFFAFLAPLLF